MEQLCADLPAIEHCEIIPSDNQEVVVLVTDTPDEEAESKLQKMLKYWRLRRVRLQVARISELNLFRPELIPSL